MVITSEGFFYHILTQIMDSCSFLPLNTAFSINVRLFDFYLFTDWYKVCKIELSVETSIWCAGINALALTALK